MKAVSILEHWQRAEAFGDDFEGSPCMCLPNRPDREGYVTISTGRGNARKMQTAHRAIYEALIGPIPADLQLDHRCAKTNGLRSCVNPWHLEPVTGRVNVLRSSLAPASINAKKTHCKRGHEFTPENTITVKRMRNCRMCVRAYGIEWSKRRFTDPSRRARKNELWRKRYHDKKARYGDGRAKVT